MSVSSHDPWYEIAATQKPGGPVAIEGLMTRVSDVLAGLPTAEAGQIGLFAKP